MTDKPVSYFPVDDPAARLLPAKPEPILLRPSETALIIVDMQNAYASPGGTIESSRCAASDSAIRRVILIMSASLRSRP